MRMWTLLLHTVFWNLIDFRLRKRKSEDLLSSVLMVAIGFPGTLVLPYQTTRRRILEDSNVMSHTISYRRLFSKAVCSFLIRVISRQAVGSIQSPLQEAVSLLCESYHIPQSAGKIVEDSNLLGYDTVQIPEGWSQQADLLAVHESTWHHLLEDRNL